LIAIEM